MVFLNTEWSGVDPARSLDGLRKTVGGVSNSWYSLRHTRLIGTIGMQCQRREIKNIVDEEGRGDQWCLVLRKF